MRRVKRTPGERGLSSLELTMAMPLLAFCLVFLIGVGHALITKQHSMVAAQFAANHQRIREAGPSAAQVGQSVSHGAEVFRLDGGGDETISYTASTTPQRGLLARRGNLNDAVSKYQTISKTGSCVPDCKPFDSFARLLSPETLTGLIFSFGGGGDLPGQGILDAINGKKKNRQQAPQGEVANLNAQGPTMVAAAAAGGGGGRGNPGGGNPGGTGAAPAGNPEAANSGADPRAGKPFTPKGKQTVIDENRRNNGGVTKCEECGVETVPAEKSQKGVTPPPNETQVDHIDPKSKGGAGSPPNGQVLCRRCNRAKSDKPPKPRDD